MREAITTALRSIMIMMHMPGHIARIIPPTDIKGLALQNRIILLLIGLHTAISVAIMATRKTPTVHVTAIQTSAIGHKKKIEDVITSNRDDKETTVTTLMSIVRTRQTARTMEQRIIGIDAHNPLINARPLITTIALGDTNRHISMKGAIHPIRLHLTDREEAEITGNTNNSRGTMSSSIMPHHVNREMTEDRKSNPRKLNQNGWKHHQR
jgi:hypothetical protein